MVICSLERSLEWINKRNKVTSEDGEEKWTLYKFTTKVLDIFYQIYYERIYSAANQLPNPEDFAIESFS